MDDRADMLVLLERLAAECAAATDARSWSASVGLASGAVVELGRVDLDALPTVILEDRRGRAVVYTTLRDVVHLELRKGGAPRLEGSLAAGREDGRAVAA
jgi:hypothetical protein